MILESIKDFEWVNEPLEFNFSDKGLVISTSPNTDLWQNIDSDFHKDNAHMFICNHKGNFEITAKWSFNEVKSSCQCGILVRSDELNWLKLGLLSSNPYKYQIGVVSASMGSCDWSCHNIPENTKELYFKLKRIGFDYMLYYSLNGINFEQIRMLHHKSIALDASVGAYACSPKNESFKCILEQIKLI